MKLVKQTLKKVLAVSMVFFFAQGMHAQVNLTNAASGNGSYSTLKDCLDAVNAADQSGQEIVITISADLTLQPSATLDQGNWTSLEVKAQGARTIQYNDTIAPIVLNGADRVKIWNGGGANTLLIQNLSTNGSGIILQSHVNNVIIEGLTFRCSTLSNSKAAIVIAPNATAGTGHNNIVILGNSFNGQLASAPVRQHIYSAGTSASKNDSIQVLNNEFVNFYALSGDAHGVNLSAHNSNCRINNNHFYHTATFMPTGGIRMIPIYINSTGNNAVENNFIGGNASAASGTATMNTTFNLRYIGIFSGCANASSVLIKNNIIRNLDLTHSTQSNFITTGVFSGIYVDAGPAIITQNQIGSLTQNNSIVNTNLTLSGYTFGIQLNTTSNSKILDNQIGGIWAKQIVNSNQQSFIGIFNRNLMDSLWIEGNTVGGSSLGKIELGSTTSNFGASEFTGIRYNSPGKYYMGRNNVVQNMQFNSTGNSSMRGMHVDNSAGKTTKIILTQNTVKNLTCKLFNGTYSGQNNVLSGISVNSGASVEISGNTIENLLNNNTLNTTKTIFGINVHNVTKATIDGNRIYRLNGTFGSVSATDIASISGIVTQLVQDTILIRNNMISLGHHLTDTYGVFGIWMHQNGTNYQYYEIAHNTINLVGTSTNAAQYTSCIMVGDFANNLKKFPVKVHNNILLNRFTGISSLHFTHTSNYYFTGNNPYNNYRSDYNYFAQNLANFADINTTMSYTAFKSTYELELHSVTGGSVLFVNDTNNLHIANNPSSYGVIDRLSYTAHPLDVDVATRPFMSQAVTGIAFADFGADEVTFSSSDVSGPEIVVEKDEIACQAATMNFTVHVYDVSGLNASGSTTPKLYYKKNNGSWNTVVGNLQSNTGQSQTWQFSILQAIANYTTGDTIRYFVLAQDIAGRLNTYTYTGLTASNVNNVSVYPTSTPYRVVSAPNFAGDYTVGTGGNFTTLTQAAHFYNTNCLNGNVRFLLIDSVYTNATESFPIVFKNNETADATHTLTIQPNSGVNATIRTTSTANAIEFQGAHHIVINGSNTMIQNTVCPLLTATRNLSVVNNSGTTAQAVIAVYSDQNDQPSEYISIVNTKITGNNPANVSAGILFADNGLFSWRFVGGGNHILIENNNIGGMQYGIMNDGKSTIMNSDYTIRLNSMNESGSGAIGNVGIYLNNVENSVIDKNRIGNITSNNGNDVAAILIGRNRIITNQTFTYSPIQNVTISNNFIENLYHTGANSCLGIAVITSASSGQKRIYNNVINKLNANSGSNRRVGGVFTDIPNDTIEIVHNTICINGTTVTGGAVNPTGVIFFNNNPLMNLKNNIFQITADNGSMSTYGYAVTGITFNTALNADYNVFDNTAVAGVMKYPVLVNSAAVFYADLLEYYIFEDHSKRTIPVFVSEFNPVLMANANPMIENEGISTFVTVDQLCHPRNSTLPDIGAFEVCTSAELDSVRNIDIQVCEGTEVEFVIGNPRINDEGSFVWRDGSCNGSVIGTGDSISIIAGASEQFALTTSGQCIAPLCYQFGITVDTPAPFEFLITPGDTVCPNATASISASGSTSFMWDNSYMNDQPVTISSDTTFYITGTNGICVYTDSVTVITHDLDFMLLNSPTEIICEGDLFNLDVMSNHTVSWTGGVQNGVDFQPSASEVYVATITTIHGCSEQTQVAVTVHPKPVPVIVIAPNDTICAGSEVTIDAGSSYTVQWTNYSNNTPVVLATSEVFSGTVTNEFGCSETMSAEIQVHPNPVISLIISPNDSICEGTSVTLTASTSDQVSWNPFITNGAEFVPTLSGTYTLTQVTAEGCSADTSVYVTILDNPVVNLGADITQENGPVILDAGVFDAYFWSTAEETQSISVTGSGQYIVIVTDENGCSGNDTISVSFTANLQEEQLEVEVYPNPFTEYILVKNDPLQEITLTIYDANGKMVHRQAITQTQSLIDASRWQSGTYFLELIHKGQKQARSIVKQNN